MKIRLRVKLIFIAIAMLAGLCGCSNEPKTPSEVVVAAFMAANSRDYERANSYVSSELLMMAKMFTGGNMSRLWDKDTHNGLIQNIEIISNETNEGIARVVYTIHYKDGETKQDTQKLKKEDGFWRFCE